MFKAHVAAIEAALRGCATIAIHSSHTVELSPNTGYVEGEALFVDSSRLVFFEFLCWSGSSLDRERYRYHYEVKRTLLIRQL
jgi:hypothetical protein